MEQCDFSYFTMTRIIGIIERAHPETKRFILFLPRKVSRVVELEASHWHPPSLPPHRTQSLRQSSGKKPGGQVCHDGYRINLCEDPDTVVRHVVGACRHCGHALHRVKVDAVARRQVRDFPLLKMEVEEYCGEIKTCPSCGKTTEADFPEEASRTGSICPPFSGPGSLFDEWAVYLGATHS